MIKGVCMKKSSLALMLSSSLIASTALAGVMGPMPKDWAWVSTLSMGAVWQNGGNTQTFFLTPDIEKTFTADKSTNALFDGELFVGFYTPISSMIQSQVGIAFAGTSNASISGHIWDDADPEFDNFVYNYHLQHTHVALKGKLLAQKEEYFVIPWVSGSLGVGFNNASSYSNRPTIFEAVATPNFANHTETAFTYTLGAGIQKTISQNWQVGVGYEFADWGKSRLGSAAGQTLNSGLKLEHLYTNGILLNLTCLA